MKLRCVSFDSIDPNRLARKGLCNTAQALQHTKVILVLLFCDSTVTLHKLSPHHIWCQASKRGRAPLVVVDSSYPTLLDMIPYLTVCLDVRKSSVVVKAGFVHTRVVHDCKLEVMRKAIHASARIKCVVCGKIAFYPRTVGGCLADDLSSRRLLRLPVGEVTDSAFTTTYDRISTVVSISKGAR